MTTRALSLHADYACGRSGRCCTAGWAIPVEPPVERTVRAGLAAGRLRLPVAAAGPPVRAGDQGAPAVLAMDARGRCVFFAAGTPSACAIHRDLGHEHLPMACRQFPRMAVLSPLGVSVTLSHYCPTAAGMLFRDDRGLEIVEDAPSFPPGADYEGLDARAGLPLLRPGVFLDWKAHRLWEEHAVRTLAGAEGSPEGALARLRARAEEARAWTAERGTLTAWIAGMARGDAVPGHAEAGPFDAALVAWRQTVSCVPVGIPGVAPVDDSAVAAADARWVLPAWTDHARTIRRYLAAKAFASWCAVQGDGLRTAVAFLEAALGVLRVEAGRACAAAGGPLDAAALKEAIRAADLLLVHLVSPGRLARRLSECEDRWPVSP